MKHTGSPTNGSHTPGLVAGSLTDHELPPTGALDIAVATLAATLERRSPGFLEDWQALTEDPTVHAAIRRLREPPITPTLTEALRGAVVFARHTRLVTLSWVAERKARKRRRDS